MWEKIINWLNCIACINVVTPRRAILACIMAIRTCDKNGDGELNIKELISNLKEAFKALIFTPDMTVEEIHKALDEILQPSK